MELSGTETDEILALAAAAGLAEAFESLVRRHGAGVRTLLERLVGHHHDAWDLTQEVWLKVHASLGSFDARRPFRPWLLRIAMNHGRDALRRQAVGPTICSDPEPERAAGVDPSRAVLERAEIAHALDRVGEPYREALVLVDVLGLSYGEAAESLDCALGTVKSRVGRGRGEFRRHYDRSPRAGDRRAERARGGDDGTSDRSEERGPRRGSILSAVDGRAWLRGQSP